MKRVWERITTAVLVIVISLAALVTIPRLLGYRSFTVLSGSMEPGIMTGSLAFIKPASHTGVTPGDIITFALGDMVVTHRIVRDEPENRAFITKGDANEDEDIRPVSYDSIIGKYSFSIPLLGYLSGMVKSGGIPVVIFTVAAVVLFMLLDIGQKKEKGEIPNE